jgi:dynein heavy chain
VNNFIDTILVMQPRVSGGKAAKTPEEIVEAKCMEFQNVLPEIIDWANAHAETKAELRPGVMLSLGVFVRQELDRFNKLLKEVKKNLASLVNALKGTEVMS